ncbi:hypothetical protein THTE_2706 [Thermogutta terrifontis]|uniref:Uncharacterized protein n=1 Tax=Thermogutta terrifontis TaxID=1331910 RepID=A0A286RH77_9BACT|nr:hypothetical protein THTE_2706 [Thermogutta terrifontis]
MMRLRAYQKAVVCGESSLGYTRNVIHYFRAMAVVCGESSLGYTALSL